MRTTNDSAFESMNVQRAAHYSEFACKWHTVDSRWFLRAPFDCVDFVRLLRAAPAASHNTSNKQWNQQNKLYMNKFEYTKSNCPTANSHYRLGPVDLVLQRRNDVSIGVLLLAACPPMLAYRNRREPGANYGPVCMQILVELAIFFGYP